jgi:hypothetical protein
VELCLLYLYDSGAVPIVPGQWWSCAYCIWTVVELCLLYLDSSGAVPVVAEE